VPLSSFFQFDGVSRFEDTRDVLGELGTFHTVHLVCLSLSVDSYPLPLSAAPYKPTGSTGKEFYPVLRF
jgi:hypothetical protein